MNEKVQNILNTGGQNMNPDDLIRSFQDPSSASKIARVIREGKIDQSLAEALAINSRRNQHPLRIFGCPSCKMISESICQNLKIKPGNVEFHEFASGAVKVQYQDSLRNNDVFIIQSLPRLQGDFAQLYEAVNAARRADANKITVVAPYFEARQDRKDRPRTTITPRDIADALELAGVKRLITLDPHVPQFSGFFRIPVDVLFARKVFSDQVQNKLGPFDPENDVVLAPDRGAVQLAGNFATDWGLDLAIIDKRRPRPNQAKVKFFYGDVRGKRVIIVDDLFDTGGTSVGDAEYLITQQDALEVHVVTIHGMFSAPAIERVNSDSITSIITTNTLSQSREIYSHPKVTIGKVDDLLAIAIWNAHIGESISSLFTLSDYGIEK